VFDENGNTGSHFSQVCVPKSCGVCEYIVCVFQACGITSKRISSIPPPGYISGKFDRDVCVCVVSVCVCVVLVYK